MVDNFKRFDLYFHGQLSANEVLEFEAELSTNPDLQEEYDLFLSIRKAAFDLEKDKIRQQLESIDISNADEETVANPQSKATIYTLMKWVSATAALFFIGMWGYQSAQSTDPQELFAQNFERYEMQQSRGQSEVNAELNPENLMTEQQKLYYATSLLEESRALEAINYLKEIRDDSTFRDQKYWYLGLASLKSGDLKGAIEYFNHLQKISNYKKKGIDHILSKLE